MKRSNFTVRCFGSLVAVLLFAGSTGLAAQGAKVTEQQIVRGRQIVIDHACGGCHGGSADPSADGWLVGMKTPDQEFLIGACLFTPGAQPCFRTRPRNLTPDNTTGLGRFSERQIFNALRYG